MAHMECSLGTTEPRRVGIEGSRPGFPPKPRFLWGRLGTPFFWSGCSLKWIVPHPKREIIKTWFTNGEPRAIKRNEKAEFRNHLWLGLSLLPPDDPDCECDSVGCPWNLVPLGQVGFCKGTFPHSPPKKYGNKDTGSVGWADVAHSPFPLLPQLCLSPWCLGGPPICRQSRISPLSSSQDAYTQRGRIGSPVSVTCVKGNPQPSGDFPNVAPF